MVAKSETRSSVPDRHAVLDRHVLFKSIGPEIRRRLGEYARTRRWKKGATIFAKGDKGLCLYAVCSGIVQVIVPSAQGKNAVFNLVREGEIFGEVALLDGGPRTADAVAFTDCELLVVDRRDFISLLRGQPDVMFKLIEVLCARLRQTTEQVEDLVFFDLRTRLVKTLMRLSSVAVPAGRIAITQTDLSEIVGMSREMINKQLQVWAKDGWIRVERKRLTILRPDMLERVLAGD